MKPWETMNLPKSIRKKYSNVSLADYRRRFYIGASLVRTLGKQQALDLGLVDQDSLINDEAYGAYIQSLYPGVRYIPERIVPRTIVQPMSTGKSYLTDLMNILAEKSLYN